MRKHWICLSVIVAAGFAARAADASIEETRVALEELVKTRTTLARVKADWVAEKETLQQTVQLFEKDLANFKELIAGVDKTNVQADQERKEQEALKASLDEASDKAKVMLTGLEAKVLQLAKRLPPPLTEHPNFAPIIKAIPANPAETKLSISQRLANVVTLMVEADKFNGLVTVAGETRKSPGGEMAVQTLYLGLAQAWFVDKSGTFAGMGVPGADGWQWTEQPALGAKIKQAIASYENTQPAEFVALPVKIQ